MQEYTTERFAGLDLLRGIAAGSVLFMHCWTTPSAWPQPLPNLLPRAYLAVDLFFVLSGFVLAHAYGHRLGSAVQFRQYCVARLIRLYPFYLAATLLAAAEMFAAILIGHNVDPNIASSRLAISLATALLFIPTPIRWSVWPPFLFPMAFTAWSLLWELFVNLFYGLGGPRFRGGRLAVPIVFGGLCLCLAVSLFGSAEPGGYWHGWWVGGIRALFSFFVGVALFQFRRRCRARSAPLPVLGAVLLAAFVPGGASGIFDVACIVLLFPLLVWLAADASMGPRLRRFALLAGFLSYPVYLLQAPLLWALPPLAVRLSGVISAESPREIFMLVYPCFIIAAAWLIARWFDSPVRDWLRRRFPRGAPQPVAQSVP